MKRRDFLAAAGTSAAAAASVGLSGCPVASTTPPASVGSPAVSPADGPASAGPIEKPEVKLYAGTQRSPTSARMLQFIKRHGVDHVCGFPPHPGPRHL